MNIDKVEKGEPILEGPLFHNKAPCQDWVFASFGITTPQKPTHLILGWKLLLIFSRRKLVLCAKCFWRWKVNGAYSFRCNETQRTKKEGRIGKLLDVARVNWIAPRTMKRVPLIWHFRQVREIPREGISLNTTLKKVKCCFLMSEYFNSLDRRFNAGTRQN